jgi:hypothetical protein
MTSSADEADPRRELALYPRNGHVEVVERALHAEPHEAAFRGIGVHVVEVLEPGRIFRLPHHREGMPPDGLLGRRRAKGQTEQDESGDASDHGRLQARGVLSPDYLCRLEGRGKGLAQM